MLLVAKALSMESHKVRWSFSAPHCLPHAVHHKLLIAAPCSPLYSEYFAGAPEGSDAVILLPEYLHARASRLSICKHEDAMWGLVYTLFISSRYEYPFLNMSWLVRRDIFSSAECHGSSGRQLLVNEKLRL